MLPVVIQRCHISVSLVVRLDIDDISGESDIDRDYYLTGLAMRGKIRSVILQCDNVNSPIRGVSLIRAIRVTMIRYLKSEQSYTLVELMIVVVIVGILAGVAVPIYVGLIDRARVSEAVANLGSIRSAQWVYYAEYETYCGLEDSLVTPRATGNMLDITQVHLDGRYFSYHCYTFAQTSTASTYKIKCDGKLSNAPKASKVSTIVRYMNQDGNLTQQ